MTTSNHRKLKSNDKIVLTYNNGSTKEMIVTNVTEKSWYVGKSRNSFGTLENYFNNSGDIIKCEII